MTVPSSFVTMPLASATVPQSEHVHLWKVALSEVRVATHGRTGLSAQEHDRYQRFRRADDAHRFAARRIALRSILSAYLDCSPTEVTYETYGSAGKPMLTQPDAQRLVFNASSSADVALIAVAPSGTLGVDVEYAWPFDDMDQIAMQYFTASECARLNTLEQPRYCAAFYRLWTAKEALLKAIGTGLPGGLDRFDVSSDPSQPPALLHDTEGPTHLHLYPADPGQGYFGAIALDLPGVTISRFVFDPADAP